MIRSSHAFLLPICLLSVSIRFVPSNPTRCKELKVPKDPNTRSLCVCIHTHEGFHCIEDSIPHASTSAVETCFLIRSVLILSS